MEFSKNRSAGYLANLMARLFAEGLYERIRPLGISPGQFPALLELWERGSCTQADLVRATDVEQATMAATLKRMERDDLIHRKPHPDDSRARVIFLSEKGKAIREAAYEAAKAQNKAALAGLSDEEVEQFIDLMLKVIATMRSEKEH
ncbi:MarR family transcriptional regulator [Pseudovibrio exalbescens]|uniref:MarR family winged helix-turn-helix transcriptional regulator n=1 Tax=Pseudovibrio exalbescens TaxID=197461 RepID=UPI0023665143|nr:MarR family transcriptional regulator [Pseudovibrio exalbescens]MDD7910902.1 MarR family transcriptional regulator [Pseudovibrio exalbescens]